MTTKTEKKPASIFIEAIKDYVEVTGACSMEVDGKNHIYLVCMVQTSKAEILMNPVDLPVYFGRSGVPF